MRFVRPGGGQPAGLDSVADALAAYRVDHAPGVPDHHEPPGVAPGAPHPHLEGPALGRPLGLGAFEPAGDLGFLEEAVEEVLEVAPRALERPGRDPGPDVGLAVSEVEDPAVPGAVLVHVPGDEDVQVLFVRPVHTAVVPPPRHGVLVRLHAVAREAAHAV